MISLFVPGRLCLFGEHSDWAATMPGASPGACIIAGTDQGIAADVVESDDFELDDFRVPMDGAQLNHWAETTHYFRYAAGVAAEVWDRCKPGGVRIRVTNQDLPIGRGLSSSASICVLTARAFNRTHALGLDVRTEMDIAFRGELRAGSPCGRMDQACAHGKKALLLTFSGESMSVDVLQPGRPLHLLIVDLMQEKDTRRILSDLRGRFERLRDALGQRNLEIVNRARLALEAGDGPALGAIMVAAQELFDRDVAPACPLLAAPRLHAVLSHPAARDLAWGGKGVGSQGDGAAQFVCRGPKERDALAAALGPSVRCLPLTL